MRIIGQIYEETDYSAFCRLNDNRDVLMDRLNKLVASISERYILNPIIVNENMQIIDGQGRYEALKSLNKPIHYIVANGATSDDCRRMNKYNTRWSALDFAKSFAKAGLTAYKILLTTCEETGLAISRVLRLTNHGTTDQKKKEGEPHKMSIFETGRLNFDEADKATAKMVAACAADILEALLQTVRPNDAFYISVKIMCETEGYDHERMLKNCALNRATYTQMSNLSSQLKEFERIYNYNRKNGNKLYFSDYLRNKGLNVRDYDTPYSARKAYFSPDISTLKQGSRGRAVAND